MIDIQRIECGPRMSSVVIHNNVAYLSGVVARDFSGDVAAQTRDILQQIDDNLAKAGTGKDRILTAQIWLKDIGRDFAAMNKVWEEWGAEGHMPARATCEAQLAAPDVLIEIIVTAAV